MFNIYSDDLQLFGWIVAMCDRGQLQLDHIAIIQFVLILGVLSYMELTMHYFDSVYCMFHQEHCAQHSCSSTQFWSSVLPSIVETKYHGCSCSFRKRICDLLVHRGQKCYTPTAFGKLWTTPEVRCMEHASS